MDCTEDEVGGVVASELDTLGSSAVDVSILVALDWLTPSVGCTEGEMTTDVIVVVVVVVCVCCVVDGFTAATEELGTTTTEDSGGGMAV